jgi:hypothetical protein
MSANIGVEHIGSAARDLHSKGRPPSNSPAK